MKNDLSCGVVRDLLPGYIDELTSEETNGAIELHLEGCEGCRGVLAAMRGEDEAVSAEPSAEKEIDYLKKVRSAARKRLAAGILAATLLLGAGFWYKVYRYGSSVDPSAVTITSITRLESGVRIGGYLKDKSLGVTHESLLIVEDGVAEYSLRAAKKNGMDNDFLFGVQSNAYEDLHEIRMGDRILWYEGVQISERVSDVYNARHAYVGDMPANAALARALGIEEAFGPYENELQTTQEPYGWIFRLQNPVIKQPLSTSVSPTYGEMTRCAAVLIACVDNLDWVEFSFFRDGQEMRIRMDDAAATEMFAGNDTIKECADNPAKLQYLMRLLDLD